MIAEDITPIISMISPYETRFLDRIGDAPYPAKNVYHQWAEETLNPHTLVCSLGLTNATTTYLTFTNNNGRFVQVGDVLVCPTMAGATEYLLITARTYNSTTNTITVQRSFGGTTASSYAAGVSFRLIHSTALEGADVSVDISQPRSRTGNYCMIFKKDIIVSGTQEAVTQIGNITSEYNHQKQMRLREALRDLEQAVFLSILSGNTIGTSTAYRTMNGLWNALTTNAQSLATLTESWLGSSIGDAWTQGGTDVDLIVMDAVWKRIIDGWNATRVRVDNQEDIHRNLITYYEGTYGRQEIMLSRWMRASSLMVVAVPRVKVVPLNGRSFQHIEVAKTGDAMKGMIIGEYTLEYKNQEGMAKAYYVSA